MIANAPISDVANRHCGDRAGRGDAGYGLHVAGGQRRIDGRDLRFEHRRQSVGRAARAHDESHDRRRALRSRDEELRVRGEPVPDAPHVLHDPTIVLVAQRSNGCVFTAI
jgi:hypothetical protein